MTCGRSAWAHAPGTGPPPTLPGFDFPCETVSRADALALAQQLARKLNLPLHEADREHGTEHFAANVATEVHGPADVRQGGPRE